VYAFNDGLWDAQRNIPSFMTSVLFPDNEHTGLFPKKFTNLIDAQVPHLGDFRNGIMPLGVHRGFEL
jgi:hypothetical protein